MDVRFFDFLARQPSAKLTARSTFCGLPKRGLALILANAMFWQPLLAQADGIAVSGTTNTTLGQAGNGVPIVNIAAPNAGGLSHNQYQQYNVGTQGVILNNATDRTQSTQLGGIILGNQNLNGRAANTILNEVTGANATQLKGYTEVAGQAARVIVANPYGISCNGCGFINTPQATLSTGKPVLDSAGGIDHFHVDGGSVSIDGAGLNADNVDRFDIITRSAKINAELHAKQLNIVTGRNDVNAQTLNATALADDGSAKPQLAIDSSALGGMYAGAIRLVGTEAGVGVKLAGNLAASEGDIQIDANGQLSMAQVAANGAVNVKAASADVQGAMYGNSVDVQTRDALTIQQNIAAQSRISLSSNGQLTNNAIVEAGVNADNSRNNAGDVALSAKNLKNNGTVIASRDVSVATHENLDNSAHQISAGRNLTLNAQGTLNNQKGKLVAQGGLTVKGVHLDNRSGGTLSGQAGVQIGLTGDLNNSNGLINSEGTLDVAANQLINTAGSFSSAGNTQVAALGVLDNQHGSISADGTLSLTSARLDNRNQGAVSAKGATVVSTGTLDNSHSGQITSADRLTLTATQVTNQDNGRIAASQAVNASVTGLDQQNGELFSNGTLNLDLNHGQLNNQNGLINSPGALLLKNLAGVNNQNGEISSAQGFTFNAASLGNGNGKLISDQALVVRVAQALDNVNGVISAGSLDASSASLNNTGGLFSSHGAMTLAVTNTLTNHNATVIADGTLSLTAANVDNSLGQIASKQDLIANIGGLQQQGGQFVALGRLSLTGNTLDNRDDGLVSANGPLSLDVGVVDNRGGELSSQDRISLSGQQLDNSDGGRIIGQKELALVIDTLLNRNAGQLSGKTGVSLTGIQLDNSAGSLSSLQNLDLRLNGNLLNSLGLLSAEGTLAVHTGSLNNNGGTLSSAGALSVDSIGAVTSQGGRLVTDDRVNITSASLDNTLSGSISGKGPVVIQTGNVDNSNHGRITSGAGLELTAAQLTNRDGGNIGSQVSLLASVTGLDQQGGRLFSNGSLTLDLNHGQLNNQNGLINAPGALLLNNLAGVDNQNGEISSAQSFTFGAESLDNGDGKLLSNQALIVRVAQALNNVKGMIAAASLDVKAGSLNNSGGTLTSRSDLALNVDGLLRNDNDGLINAANTLNAQATGISNIGGALLANTALNLDLNGADLDNSNGLITTQNPLTITHLRDLKNAGGELSSALSFSLTGRTLDNSGGKLISNQTLTLNADSLLNQLGLISGWQGLSVSGGSLDNRNSGTLSSRSGDVGVVLTGALLNGNDGALVSQNALNVAAASVDNQGGILSSGAGQTYTVSGLLNNGQNGLIDSGAGLTLNATTLNNAAGTINAQQALTFTGTDLDNSAGSIASNAAITLDLLGSLTNTNGQLASAGDLLIQRATQINNQGGQLASQRALTLFTQVLDNRNRGTVAANDALILTASGAIQNANDGLIYSKNADLTVQAVSLANNQGTLQSQGALNVTISGDIDSQTGKIIAQSGDLTLTANNVDNRGGVLSSLQNAFTARITGVLKNGYDLNHQGGITQAQNLDIRALAGLDNYGGRISAQTGDALINTGSGNFDNRNGGLYAKQKINVTGNSFDNSGDNDGQIAGQQIDLNLSGTLNNRLGIIESDSTLSIKAASVDNQTGKIRAMGTSGTSQFQIGGLFDNRLGTLETANTDLALGVGSLLNAGGSVLHVGSGNFGISTANVINAGGSFVTRGAMTLSADSWTNSSVLQAGSLNINVNNFTQTATGQLLASNAFTGSGVNWTNDGLIASDGTLSLNLSGIYSGNGRLTSLGTLGLSASQLSLGSAGSIAGGAHTDINVAGQSTTYGRITSAADMLFNASSIANYGTLGAAQGLTLTTPVLTNDQGLIFSGGDMVLRAGDVTNRNADIYSLGSLSIGGLQSGGWANSITNLSGSIESNEDLVLAANSLINQREVFEVTGSLTGSSIGVRCIDCAATADWMDWMDRHASQLVWLQDYNASVGNTSAESAITAGRDLVVNGGSLQNVASTISAVRNASITVNDFENRGYALGSYSVRSLYSPPGNLTEGFLMQILGYNAINDVDYDSHFFYADGTFDPNIHFLDRDYNDSVQHLLFIHGNGKNDGRGWHLYFGTMNFEFQDGGHLNDAEARIPRPAYAPTDAGIIPAPLSGLSLIDQVTTNGSAVSNVSSVVQAGGSLVINASQNLNNSVVQGAMAVTKPAAQGLSTGVSSVTPTVISLNKQLPPDLAQQQVDPTTLPGFSLPTGQNGLFRLSGQGGNQASATPQSWSVGSTTVSTSQRDQALPGSSSRDVLIGNTNTPSATGQSLTVADRQDTGDTASLPGLTRVQGVPSSAAKPGTGKYLIETNPVLTDLKQFMSSDYMLSALGYDPDLAQKRLGDGLYEQRLVQQAVTARTGQAFIDGQTSNEDQFKYLMNNAIASKDELNLSVGVSLTSQQVAALTHDIVWLEEHEVNGEKVLVPVLYLAQADNRLAPNGALIAGNDVTLIAGQNLENVGTLKATNNLSASAGTDLVNSGLISAGDRLDLLAGNNITNRSGGIITGRDVAVSAVNGDVTNERTLTEHQVDYRNTVTKEAFLDSSARIEAANDLSLSAGRDLVNTGALQSGRDLTLSAGRDVNLLSVATQTSFQAGSNFSYSTTTQNGSLTSAGRDLSVTAGRDVMAIASQIDAKRDIAMAATGDLTLNSATDEDHSYSKSKKVTAQNDHVSQVSSTLTAGGDIALKAGNDLGIIASNVKATGDVSLDAGQDVYVTSAQNEDYSYYKKKKKGSFGRSSTRVTESYHSDNVASVVEAGHDLSVNTTQDAAGAVSLNGGRDVAVIGSQLSAGNDMLIGATNDVSIVSAAEESGSYSKKTKSGLFGISKSGKSQLTTAETQVGSALQAGNDAVLVAGRDVDLSASTLVAGRDAELHAGLLDDTGDVNLTSASNSTYSHAESYKSGLGLSGSLNSSGIAGSIGSSTQRGHEVTTSAGVGSQVVAGRDAILDATRDINIIGSSVDAQQTAALDAGRDVNVVAGADSTQSTSWKSSRDSGLSLTWDRNGFTGFVGETKITDASAKGAKTASASSVSGGNIGVDAGQDVNIQGSDLYADNNIDLKAGRDIRVNAAAETDSQGSSRSVTTNGVSVTVNHNYGNTVDALKNVGKGDDLVSQASSVMKAADTVDQFFRGATMDESTGNKRQGESLISTVVSNRGSTLNAGNDISMDAGNDVTVRGGALQAGRDINVKGKDISLDVAKGSETSAGQQSQSKSGIVGGTTGGFKVGIGASSGAASQDGKQGTSSATELYAGRDVNLNASNDLSLIGTRVDANRNIDLKAGNDLTIHAAQNDSSSKDSRHSGGGEVGLTVGQGGIGVYASVNLGRGNLDREAAKQQEAYLYAGNTLGFESGRDTTVAGATLRGDNVIGNVGRDLTVSSVPDTGKVTGKEFDVSATVTVGYGGSVSGSVGYGQTTGSTNWVGNQTSITAKDKLDIRTEQHTQIDGAVLASDSGNLKLDTGTLGFSDIAGKDKEQGYYLNVGGTYGWGASGTANQDANQVGKGKDGESGWNVSGYNYNKDREQIVRATVGAGDITVRDDAQTGNDSTAGLNRDLSKAYEITRDDEHRTDLYVSSSSIDLVTHPLQTLQRWKDAALNFDKVIKGRITEVTTSAERLWSEIQAQRVSVEQIPEASRKALGDQRALDVGKNLVRAGLDPALLATLPATVTTQLNDWANCAAGACPVTSSNGSAEVNGPTSGTVLTLDETVTQGVTPFMALFLTRTSDLIQEINKLPVQEAQVAMLAMQAAMGPAKATLSIALNALAHAAFGEQYEKLKEELAITLTAELTETDRQEIQDANDEAKRLYSSNDHSVFQLDGDSQVLATEFLIDLVGGGLQSLGGKATGKVVNVVGDKVQTGSLKPEWLSRLQAGNDFNKVQSKNYPYNEVYIQREDGKGYYRVDSYNPVTEEIISRKFTQLSEVSEATAKNYISEAVSKYSPGATIAKVPSSGSLGGQKLQGTVILEIPPQNGPIPLSVLDAAKKADVILRDTNGKVY
ncbi:hemagglutinin repeat-containing protein [Pseudomonas sp. Pseu.R1]|uniref:hemagglutinin repeat-containing protein n=1 Tax=Pseudomonas sp. Pseu.R1 TaxID=3379818 RepID=UPI003B9494D1